VVVRNAADLEAFVRRCLADGDYARRLGSRAQELVRQQIGASDRTVELLMELVPRPAHAKAA
jgi:hypothetical protein